RVQIEVDVAGFAGAPEGAVTLGDALEPLVVLEVDDVRVLQELAIQPLRLGGPPGGEQALRARQELCVRFDHFLSLPLPSGSSFDLAGIPGSRSGMRNEACASSSSSSR